MAIRFKKYSAKSKGYPVDAIRITEANLVEIVNYITKNGGAATGHETVPAKGKAKTRPGRIRLRQRNFGFNWGKQDWRVANVGDFIVRDGDRKNGYEFARVKDDQFEALFSV